MKASTLYLFYFFVLFSCNQKGADSVQTSPQQPGEKPSFIQVTSYFKGQVYNLTQAAVNPLKRITAGGKTDSVWIRVEDFKAAVAEFLTPLIDSTNLSTLFKEERFNDASLDAITLTYNPTVKLPDSIDLRRWDVYMDPVKNDVTKVYMVKERKDSSFQLTWVTDSWCSIRTLINRDGKTELLKEEKITWKF